MNKDPELNYYALKLAISLKGDDGDTFTKVYDEICKSASLTDEQVSRPFFGHFFGPKISGPIMPVFRARAIAIELFPLARKPTLVRNISKVTSGLIKIQKSG